MITPRGCGFAAVCALVRVQTTDVAEIRGEASLAGEVFSEAIISSPGR